MIRLLLRRDPVVRAAPGGAVLVIVIVLVMGNSWNAHPELSAHLEFLLVTPLLVAGAYFVSASAPRDRYADFVLSLPVSGRVVVAARILAVLVAGLLLIWAACLIVFLGFGFVTRVWRIGGNLSVSLLALVLWMHAVAPGRARLTGGVASVFFVLAGAVMLFAAVLARRPLFPLVALGLALAAGLLLWRTVPPALEMSCSRATRRRPRGRGRRVTWDGFLLRQVFWKPDTLFLIVEAAFVAVCVLGFGTVFDLAPVFTVLPLLSLFFARSADNAVRILRFVDPLPMPRSRVFVHAAAPSILVLAAGIWGGALIDMPPGSTLPLLVLLLMLAWLGGQWIAFGGIRGRLWIVFAVVAAAFYFRESLQEVSRTLAYSTNPWAVWGVCVAVAAWAYWTALRMFERVEVRPTDAIGSDGELAA